MEETEESDVMGKLEMRIQVQYCSNCSWPTGGCHARQKFISFF